jgi:hypothetical protein
MLGIVGCAALSQQPIGCMRTGDGLRYERAPVGGREPPEAELGLMNRGLRIDDEGLGTEDLRTED